MAAPWSANDRLQCKAMPDPEPDLLRSSGTLWPIIILAKGSADAG
jgi:hypothetical protein